MWRQRTVISYRLHYLADLDDGDPRTYVSPAEVLAIIRWAMRYRKNTCAEAIDLTYA